MEPAFDRTSEQEHGEYYVVVNDADNQPVQRNRRLHNRGDGTFEEILIGGIPSHSGYSYQAAWGDYDGDGYLDLFVANDSLEGNFLYRNNHREYLARQQDLFPSLRALRALRGGIKNVDRPSPSRICVISGGPDGTGLDRSANLLKQAEAIVPGQTCCLQVVPDDEHRHLIL